MSGNLWVCHDCGMIGSHVEAEAHANRRGHEIEDLGKETSDLVWEEWRRIGDPRVVTAHQLAAEIIRVSAAAPGEEGEA